MIKRLVKLAAAIGGSILAMAATSNFAWAEKRVALIVGNSSYQTVPQLPNPARDANSVAKMFRDAGFDSVDIQLNVGNLEFKRAIRKFETMADQADIAVVYYAGHGLEIGGINYLIPTDARLASDRDADDEADRGQFALLEAAGIPVRDDLRSAFMHNKFILIDGHILWTGSMNLTTNDVFRNNNNVVVLDSPAAVAVYAREFEEMWAGQFGPRSPSNVNGQTVQTVSGLPVTIRFAPEDKPFDSLVQLVALANKSIRFMAFSFTQDDLGAVMRQRASEGVVVQGIFETRGSETVYSEMPAMFCAGLEVRQDGNPGTFHHKVIIIDDFVVITGSMNFSDNAANSNDENVIAIADPAIGRLYREEFVRRWAEATTPDIACAN